MINAQVIKKEDLSDFIEKISQILAEKYK